MGKRCSVRRRLLGAGRICRFRDGCCACAGSTISLMECSNGTARRGRAGPLLCQMHVPFILDACLSRQRGRWHGCRLLLGQLQGAPCHEGIGAARTTDAEELQWTARSQRSRSCLDLAACACLWWRARWICRSSSGWSTSSWRKASTTSTRRMAILMGSPSWRSEMRSRAGTRVGATCSLTSSPGPTSTRGGYPPLLREPARSLWHRLFRLLPHALAECAGVR